MWIFWKNDNFKMWILWKMRLWKCEFCQKWDFENVNFVKNETLKLWILSKMRLCKCEFCQKWEFQNVNFWTNWGFLPQCVVVIFVASMGAALWWIFSICVDWRRSHQFLREASWAPARREPVGNCMKISVGAIKPMFI